MRLKSVEKIGCNAEEGKFSNGYNDVNCADVGTESSGIDKLYSGRLCNPPTTFPSVFKVSVKSLFSRRTRNPIFCFAKK